MATVKMHSNKSMTCSNNYEKTCGADMKHRWSLEALVRFMDTTIDGHQKTAVLDETIVIRKLLSGTKAQENCPVLVGKNEMLRRYNCPCI